MDHRDIFISFSNKDRDKVDKVVSSIRGFGASCWYQVRDSKKDYLKEINEGIKNSSAFVVFLSPDSVDSIMVRNEINRALGKLKKNKTYKILPVVIEELNEDEEDMIQLLVGSFNWLYASEFQEVSSLTLAIFEQIDLRLNVEAGVDSSYSGESAIEQKRIESQNRLFNEYAKKYLDEIFEKMTRPNILDVGCSDGKNIILRLSGREYGNLLGIDKDIRKIQEANASFSSEQNSFQLCNITTEDLDKVLRQYFETKDFQQFDIIHISAVLLHIKNPEETLKKLYPYLRDGGVIFIQDEDDGLNVVYPGSPLFDNCFYIWQHSLESGDRKMGRKIYSYLQNAGYQQIDLKSTTVCSLDFGGKYKETLWDLYFNSDLWVVEDASYFDNYEAYSLMKEYRAHHAELREEYLADKYLITLGIFFYTASK